MVHKKKRAGGPRAAVALNTLFVLTRWPGGDRSVVADVEPADADADGVVLRLSTFRGRGCTRLIVADAAHGLRVSHAPEAHRALGLASLERLALRFACPGCDAARRYDGDAGDRPCRRCDAPRPADAAWATADAAAPLRLHVRMRVDTPLVVRA